MGGEPEKLLTLEEAARRLGLPADDVEAMIREGKLPSFRLAGNLLRIRLGDVEFLQARASGHSLRERLIDFLYFNDFYLVAFLILLALLAIILIL